VLIKAMHVSRARKNKRDASCQAIRVVRANARHRKQSRGFFKHDKIVLGVNHTKSVLSHVGLAHDSGKKMR
jgi:hypothetical protein